jgi:uncharacterized protein (TIGR03435 family)
MRAYVGLLLVAALGAQTPRPAFEVASVRRSSGAPLAQSGGPGTQSPNRTVYTNVTLKNLIELAFEKMPQEITGLPGWTDQDRYDIAANIPEGASKHDAHMMLRTLIEDRFHLRTHVEVREMPAYELVVAKGGPKLRVASGTNIKAESRFDAKGDSLDLEACPLSILVGLLSSSLSSHVVDKTGLVERYDIQMHYRSPSKTSVTEDEYPSIFAAVEELGLRLEAKKEPVEVVVVDAIDRVPSEN